MINTLSRSPHSFLRVFAPAKINLHLEILGLRSDGFHELAMVMQSVDLMDELEMSNRKDGEIVLTCDDPSLSNQSDNLIVKAAELLKSQTGIKDLGVNIHLKKRIPIGAGLAGGSSDAAATLIGLNNLWGLSIDKVKIGELASCLGSDVPFCLEGGTQLCFGRGEILEPLNTLGGTISIVLVKDPSVSVSTPGAYGRFKELNASRYLENEAEFAQRRKKLRSASWLSGIVENRFPPLRNDLQEVVENETPAVQRALKVLRELPECLVVAMSGSGPSCFALYESFESARKDHHENMNDFKEAGLESWCCSFHSQGVTIDT